MGLKGDVGVREIILLAVAILFSISALVYLFTVMTGVFYGTCWSEPANKLTDLRDGKNIIDFKGCVDKAIFTNSLTSPAVTSEIDIFKSCDSRTRGKTGGSFVIVVPAKNPPSDIVKKIGALFIGKPKPKCVWKSYAISQELTIEGSDDEHCIYMTDTPTPNLKAIAEC